MRSSSHVLPLLNIRYARRWSGEKQISLTPEQIKAGTNKVRTYKDWENLFKSPEVGGKLGVSHLFTEETQS